MYYYLPHLLEIYAKLSNINFGNKMRNCWLHRLNNQYVLSKTRLDSTDILKHLHRPAGGVLAWRWQ